ncbi:MAG: Mov34/MPN/PAD-1 family protein [Deltaproteobacteria bacterium]|nr:Mov34/MPN/PAD-1 family protein [Deltaproteobacteria bacterium]
MVTDEGPERPWLEGPLALDRAVLEALDAHARECHPEESCGLLVGPAAEPSRVDEARRMDNLANREHALDPELFPRTAREAYVLNPLKVQRMLDAGDREGRPVKAIYHSHCDVGAYFSPEDQRFAAVDGRLTLPVCYVVTSVRGGGVVDDHKLFVYRGGAWVEAPLEVH